MLKERTEFVRNVLYVIDLLIITVVFFAVHFIFLNVRKYYSLDIIPPLHVIPTPYPIDFYLRSYWLALVIWAVLLKIRGEYHFRPQTHWNLVTKNVVNSLIFFGFFASFAYIFKMEFMSRVFTVFYTASCAIGIIVSRLVALSVANYVRRRGYNFRNIMLVGTGKRAQDFIRHISDHKEWGYRIIGILDQEAGIAGTVINGYKVLGTLNDLPSFLEKHVVDEVVYVVPRSWLKEIEKSILYCESVGVPATLATDFFDLKIASGVPKEMDGFTYLTFETRRLRDSELLIKRTLDILASAAALILASPVFLFVPIAIKMDSNGPVFFKQKRCGRNGRQFILYKFRSMVQGAEAKAEELKPSNEMTGPVFKMANDPRLTKIGKFLRKTSLDEFPQFWNVLKGDMSIVGPRPPLPSEVEKYEPWQRRRLSMKPGITCIWQVSGRNKIGFEEWMKLDLQYIDRWSLWLDFRIILQTILVVITGHGAK